MKWHKNLNKYPYTGGSRVSELCISELNLDGKTRREETLDPRIRELLKLLNDTENHSFEVFMIPQELMDLLESINSFEALKIQNIIFARRFAILNERYDAERTVRKICSIVECGYIEHDCLTQDEIERFVTEDSNRELIFLSQEQIPEILKEYYHSLRQYLKETKKIGLGLPDKAAIRIARVLFTVKIFLKRINIEIEE